MLDIMPGLKEGGRAISRMRMVRGCLRFLRLIHASGLRKNRAPASHQLYSKIDILLFRSFFCVSSYPLLSAMYSRPLEQCH